MVRKPARMYRDVKGQAYTRREYLGGVPASRIVRFDDGQVNVNFSRHISLVADESCQIRHNALEAARIAANRCISNRTKNYHLKIRVYPHNVLRENKQATGAGADRVSQGMRAAFGKIVSTAARVHASQKVMTISLNDEQHVITAKAALRRAGMKLPTPCSIIVE